MEITLEPKNLSVEEQDIVCDVPLRKEKLEPLDLLLPGAWSNLHGRFSPPLIRAYHLGACSIAHPRETCPSVIALKLPGTFEIDI